MGTLWIWGTSLLIGEGAQSSSVWLFPHLARDSGHSLNYSPTPHRSQVGEEKGWRVVASCKVMLLFCPPPAFFRSFFVTVASLLAWQTLQLTARETADAGMSWMQCVKAPDAFLGSQFGCAIYPRKHIAYGVTGKMQFWLCQINWFFTCPSISLDMNGFWWLTNVQTEGTAYP